jgi:hypothetical protein
MSKNWIEWIEPFSPSNQPVYCRVTEAVAIETQMYTAVQLGKPYTNEQDALEDFMQVHWARKICD